MNDSKDNGGDAFPVPTNHVYGDGRMATGGMSLRDYFAAKASEDDIRGAMSMGESWQDVYDRATARFRHADAMLEARKLS